MFLPPETGVPRLCKFSCKLLCRRANECRERPFSFYYITPMISGQRRKEMRPMAEKRTARFEVVQTPQGNQYRFFCDLSGSLVCTTEAVTADSPEEELLLAWESEGKARFNQCRKCGRWTISAMYNPDVLCCVRCAPIEYFPQYCPQCGVKLVSNSNFCHICGEKVLYGGELDAET